MYLNFIRDQVNLRKKKSFNLTQLCLGEVLNHVYSLDMSICWKSNVCGMEPHLWHSQWRLNLLNEESSYYLNYLDLRSMTLCFGTTHCQIRPFVKNFKWNTRQKEKIYWSHRIIARNSLNGKSVKIFIKLGLIKLALGKNKRLFLSGT